MTQRSYRHRGGDQPLLGTTVYGHIRDIVSRFRRRQAVVSVHQGLTLTYGKLEDAVNDVARGLVGLGFGRNSRIAIWSTNNLEWILIQLATARIGAVLVNLNPAYRKRELEHALARAAVECVVMIPAFKSSNYVDIVTAAVPGLKERDGLLSATLPDLKRVILFDPSGREVERPHPGFTTWNELVAAGADVTQTELDSRTDELDTDDPINIQFTSGTTGFPKAVVLTHHNILNNAIACARATHFTQWDRLCVAVPFYHCFGMVVSNLMTLSVGACLVIPSEYFDADAVLRAVDTQRCTALHGVPTMFMAELDHPNFADFSLRSLRTGIMAGAPCPPPLLERVMTEMHDRELLVGYGQTESSPVTHLTTRDDTFERRVMTVGTNLPHQETKVIDPGTGATVPIGEVGEICFRGYHVMRGYYGDQQATAEAIDPSGWLHSGDLGTMDADGYVRITGRLKDMVIRGGENIYPREVEDILYTHPNVAKAAVFGVPDDRLGEELVAWIKPRNGIALAEDELRTFLARELAHYKVPRYIRFVDDDEFPMTVTGKIQKYRMRQMAIRELAS